MFIIMEHVSIFSYERALSKAISCCVNNPTFYYLKTLLLDKDDIKIVIYKK